MFDKKIYKETYSYLHASENTMADVLDRIELMKSRKNHFMMQRAAVFAVMLVLGSTAVFAAGGIHFGGWPLASSGQAVRKNGFDYPDQLGEYCVDESSAESMHIAPPEYSDVRAWFQPKYVWRSIDYKKGHQSLSVCFGKTDNQLWHYCLGYDERTGIWLGALNLQEYEYGSREYPDGVYYIKNVTEHKYKECTIYLHDEVREYFPNKEHPDYDSEDLGWMEDFPLERTMDASARWVDEKSGIWFSLHSNWDWNWNGEDGENTYMREEQGMKQEELIEYVKDIIDLYR